MIRAVLAHQPGVEDEPQDLADYIRIDTEVLMNQNVSETTDLWPRHI